MSVDKRPLKIIGCGAHAKVIADIARAAGDVVDGFLDDNIPGDPDRLEVDGPTQAALPRFIKTHRFVVGIGDAAARRKLSNLVVDTGGELATLIHPTAIIAPNVRIGSGTVVMAGVIINTGSKIGRFAVVNTGAILDHDNTIEDNVQIAPGCILAGTVTCERDAFVGVGAVIIPRMVIGEGACVAAGATVIRPVRPYTLVAGTPAVEKRQL